jgi:predicted nucleotidyltransferase
MEGVSSARARELAERAAEVLARDPRVRLVFLFGSAVDDEVEWVGDIDLGILTESPLDLSEIVRLRAEILNTVPADLDLVALNDAPIVLAKEVADRGRCLYARHPGAETEFVVRARASFWDFKPFLDVQWENAGLRLEERSHGPPS